jgi:hypothetical protein
MIRILLGDSPLAAVLRFRYIFSIIPMYNPDGVELAFPRQNAHGVDLESNWMSPTPEPEVLVLRGLFQTYMQSSEPIRVALNMHSSSNGRRFFVYHSPVGTSERFSGLEKTFIQYVRNRTPGRIQPWDYFVSWTTGTALQYPESWFWVNHREFVMALTYEDIYGISNGGFDSTAEALLRGVDDYLVDPTTIVPTIAGEGSPDGMALAQNYPNPFNGQSTIRFRVGRAGVVSLVLYDLMGREIARLADGTMEAGEHSRQLSSERMASGTYVYRLITPTGVQSRVLTVMR